MVSARWLSLVALLPLVFPGLAAAKEKRIRVEYRSEEITVVNQALGKRHKFIRLKPGETIKVHVIGPLLMNVKIHDLIQPGRRSGALFTLNAERDGTHRSTVQMLLPAADVIAIKGSKLIPSRMKRRQFEVPAGEHAYAFTVSSEAKNGIALRFYKGKKARPRELVAEEAIAVAAAPPPPPKETAAPPPDPKQADESWVVVDGSGYSPPPPPPAEAGPAQVDATPVIEAAPEPVLPRKTRGGDAGRIGIGVRADFVVPLSEASLSYGVLLELRYHFPAFKGDLSVGLVGGYSPFKAEVRQSGDASRDIDPYSVKLEGHTVPVLLGLFYDLPFGLPVELGLEAGYYFAYVTLEGRARSQTFERSGTGHGYFAGGGLEYPLGPGRLGLAARWVGVPSGTGDIGGLDLGGVHVHAGYRLMF